MMKERPERVFRGGIGFYFGKVTTLFKALMLVSPCLIVALFAILLIMTKEIPREPTSLWLLALLVLIGLFNLWLTGHWLLAFAEIGVSKNYLWFRHFGLWQTLRWLDITVIDESRASVEGGLYVYSAQLPLYHHCSTVDIGMNDRVTEPPASGKRGRALYISPSLRDYDELSLVIPQWRWKATQRRHQEKRRKRSRS
jgi:hypothetical protein